VLWRFEFYRIGQGTGESVEMASESSPLGLEEAIQQARSMMATVTFTFGKADRSLITSDDGIVVREIVGDALTV
jgi:hypothetical protein